MRVDCCAFMNSIKINKWHELYEHSGAKKKGVKYWQMNIQKIKNLYSFSEENNKTNFIMKWIFLQHKKYTKKEA